MICLGLKVSKLISIGLEVLEKRKTNSDLNKAAIINNQSLINQKKTDTLKL